MNELELIVKNLDKIGTELYNKFGTDSYDIRCELHDIKDQLKAINYTRCCVSKDLDKHPIEGINETMQVDTELEEIQLCGKSNCNRQKLEGNVYCSYHYDINFG